MEGVGSGALEAAAKHAKVDVQALISWTVRGAGAGQHCWGWG